MNRLRRLKKKIRIKKKNRFMWMKILLFSGVVLLFAFVALLIPLRPKESQVEKRTLTKFPAFSIGSFLSGEFTDGVSTWYADTFPFREVLMKGNNTIQSAYGIRTNQIYGQVATADDTSAVKVSVGDLIREDMMSKALAGIEDSETAQAALAAGGGKKRREITQVPEQVGSVYVAGDTGFVLYGFNQSAADSYIDAISTLVQKVGSGVHVYNIVVPVSSGIYLDKSIQDKLNVSDQKESIDYIYNNMNPSVTTVDAFSQLEKHSDEYLYFRTDHHWTSLGAYYAYAQFMKAKGKTPTSLGAYESKTYEGFLGSLYSYSNQAPSLAENPDTVTAYIPNGTNDMVYLDYDGMEYEYKVVADADDYDSSSKYLCFISGDRPLVTIHNPQIKDGSAVVVIKESYGNCFAPFLVDSYEYTYVVDFRHFPGSLPDFIAEKNIQDVIFLNNVMSATTQDLVDNIYAIVAY